MEAETLHLFEVIWAVTSPLAYDQGTPLWRMVVMAGDGITRRDTAKDRRILLAFPSPC